GRVRSEPMDAPPREKVAYVRKGGTGGTPGGTTGVMVNAQEPSSCCDCRSRSWHIQSPCLLKDSCRVAAGSPLVGGSLDWARSVAVGTATITARVSAMSMLI